MLAITLIAIALILIGGVIYSAIEDIRNNYN